MPQEFVEIFRGSPIVVMALIDALRELGITPVVKDPSTSAKLAGFGFLTNEQSLWVHTDEQAQAFEVVKSLDI